MFLTHIERRIMWDIVVILLLLVLCIGFAGCAQAYTLDQYAEAIHKAEGNDNYGILKHYKHTSYRQACKNSVKHRYRQWVAGGRKGAFTAFLGGFYCPVGCNNDNGTNKYWINNVNYWLIRS